MTETTIAWPKKRRELHNHHFDSTIWNDFRFRNDDIVLATYANSGTGWIQQIVSQILSVGAEGLPAAARSPWLELRTAPRVATLAAVEAQTRRRFITTHLPVDALVYSPAAKYIYVGRDGRDVVWSMHTRHSHANERWYETINKTPDLVGPPIGRPTPSVGQYFRDWLAHDGYPFWPFWENVRSWWQIRHLPNLLLVHFDALKRNTIGELSRIAAFLDVPVPAQRWTAILEHCGIDYMKANAPGDATADTAFWGGGAATFMHQGRNGRWRDVLSAEDVRHYDDVALRELGYDCMHWLKDGSMPGSALSRWRVK
jgi:aryl sulfotransferase